MTCFGHLFGHIQVILENMYFLYYIITHLLHLGIGISVIGV
jgi:hypothetical protein